MCCSVFFCDSLCSSVLFCVVLCCSLLLCIALYCFALGWVVLCYFVLLFVALCCFVLLYVALFCSVLLYVALCCFMLLCVAFSIALQAERLVSSRVRLMFRGSWQQRRGEEGEINEGEEVTQSETSRVSEWSLSCPPWNKSSFISRHAVFCMSLWCRCHADSIGGVIVVGDSLLLCLSDGPSTS